MMKEEFITYGILFDREKFNPSITNDYIYLNKPRRGGLWGSPVNSGFGWKKWCELEDFNTESLNIYTKWKLKRGTKILVIDSFQDLVTALDKYGEQSNGISGYVLNYQKIKEDGYKGVMLTEKGNSECHCEKKYKDGWTSLNTWDCESIIVWDIDSIRIIEKGRL